MSSGTDLAGSPRAGAEFPGTLYTVATGTYAVSENSTSTYATSFSGDCTLMGVITVTDGTDKTCTITNDDVAIPPPIVTSVVSTPEVVTPPVSVSGGGGGRRHFQVPIVTAVTAITEIPLASGFPDTGFSPRGSASWNVVIASLSLLLVLTLIGCITLFGVLGRGLNQKRDPFSSV
jgi:hypothetical protein